MARKFTLEARRVGDEIDFRGELNDEQYAAATAPGGPMLIIAGAGSGKTRALTYRLAWLVHNGIQPDRILLVTFTNRAAREMLHRVSLLVQQRTGKIWGGTFHHIANRLLRRYGDRIGIKPDFTILDREDAGDLLKSCVSELNIATTERRFPHKRVLQSISSYAQNTLESLEDILKKRYPMFCGEYNDIRKVLEKYSGRKRRLQLLDYDDLLTEWRKLLAEDEEIRTVLAEKFQHILVDEYQDTNALQGHIIDLLAEKHRNVCVVGDDSQSIYSFRGADFRNILHFTDRYPDAKIFRIETNYRSTPQILKLANESIRNNRQRLDKELRAVRPAGLKPAIVPCHDHFVQARFIAEYILYLLDQGRKLGDIATLYRSHWHALELQLEFRKRNIPFQIRGGIRFFEQAHIKDIVSFLRIVQNPWDELAWKRVLPMLPRVAGRLSQRVWDHIAGSSDPLEEALREETATLLPAAAQPFYTKIMTVFRTIKEMNSPAEIIEEVMTSFYKDYLDTHYEGAGLRREDITGLANFAAQYRTVEAFMADVALTGEFEGETCVTGPEEQEFTILSTVHQAKGLEWPVVIIPWLADGRFPTDLAINTEEEEEEERRVFHVATTRAKDELYLVVPKVYRSRRGMIIMKPSRFLTELSDEVTEAMELEEGLPEVTVGASTD